MANKLNRALNDLILSNSDKTDKEIYDLALELNIPLSSFSAFQKRRLRLGLKREKWESINRIQQGIEYAKSKTKDNQDNS